MTAHDDFFAAEAAHSPQNRPSKGALTLWNGKCWFCLLSGSTTRAVGTFSLNGASASQRGSSWTNRSMEKRVHRPRARGALWKCHCWPPLSPLRQRLQHLCGLKEQVRPLRNDTWLFVLWAALFFPFALSRTVKYRSRLASIPSRRRYLS